MRSQSLNPRGRRGRLAPVVITAFACLLLLPGATLAAGTLDRVKQSGKLTLGYRADARPFSYRDESGSPAGYSVALCGKIAEELKAKVIFVQVARAAEHERDYFARRR